MKTKCLFLFLCSSLLIAQCYAENISFNNVTINFSLPFNDYKIIRPKYEGIEVLIIKFPQVSSLKYNSYIIPNFSVIMELIPQNTTIENYVALKIYAIQHRPGYNQNPSRDDTIFDKIPGSIDFYYEVREKNQVDHSVYVLCKIVDNVGIYILFDSTSDIYSSQRKYLEAIIKSMIITSTN